MCGLGGTVDAMDEEFKNKLLSLYPEFNRVTGPYLRKDGRKHICFNNTSLSNGDKNKKRTLSWPKALIEVREGRRLLDDETADHKDENFTNDSLENLQTLTRIDNIIKSFELNPERAKDWFIGVCSICDEKFVKPMNHVKHNLKQGKSGPFCSKSCAGKWSTLQQYAGVRK